MTQTANATNAANQRKLDRCQNGVLWTTFYDSAVGGNNFYYSTDNGVTWVNGTSGNGISGPTNLSMFIDLDDYLHVVWKQSGTGGGRTDGYIYYMRGTPNTGRTSWTWSSALLLYGNANANYPDIVAHRQGTGWKAQVVLSYADSTPTNNASYFRVDITSAGVITLDTSTAIGAGYGINIHTWPSIDFNHNGDGKTVAGSTPHLYSAWSAGSTGAGKGIRFKKATYSGGTWTWGTEREIDNTVYMLASGDRVATCVFDGTQVMIGGAVYTGSADYVRLWQRDAADTTTTVQANLATPGDGTYTFQGNITYDAAGNVYLFGVNWASAIGYYDPHYRKWNRQSATLGPQVLLDETIVSQNAAVVAKRGYSGSTIEWVSTTGNNAPYAVKYDKLTVSTYPQGLQAYSPNNPTAFGNQRKLDRTQNGVLWSFASNQTNIAGNYSVDNGVTWNFGGYLPNNYSCYNLSFFIDLDDYAHIVWKNNGTAGGTTDGRIYYTRGTPNTGRTAWTWSAPVAVFQDLGSGNPASQYDYPDLVAFRNPGGGWDIPMVCTFMRTSSTTDNYTLYVRMHITAAGVATLSRDSLPAFSGDGTAGYISADYNQGVWTWPSIDFNHTGDGKTVQGGTPHLYTSWTAGNSGTGLGLHFRKSTYSGGTWTWGTDVVVGQAMYYTATTQASTVLWDGTASYIGGTFNGNGIRVYQSTDDFATNTLLVNTPSSQGDYSVQYSVDSARNIHIVGSNWGGSGFDSVIRYKWTRATATTGTLGPRIIQDFSPRPDTTTPHWVTMRRGAVGGSVEWIYSAGSASPYAVTYDRLQVSTTFLGIANLTNTSTLTVGATDTVPGAATLSATSTLTQTGLVTEVGAAALSAASTLTAAAQVQEVAAAPLTATATLTAAAVSTLNGAAALSATSTLTAAGALVANGAVALSAASTMTVGATRGVAGAAALSAASTLTTGAVRAATALSALFAGSTLATDAVVLTSGQVTLTASSSLSTGVLVTDVATSGMSADSTLNVGGVVARNGAVDMISVSTMSGGTASVAMGIPLIGLSELDLNALVATVYDIQVGNAVSALPQPPTAYMSVSGESSLTVTPTLKVTGLAVFLPNSSLGWNTVYSGPVAVLGVSTMTQPVPDITIRSSMFLTGSTTMTTFGNLIQSHSSSEGGFVIEGFGALTVNPTYTPLPPRITVRNLLTVTPVMKTPVILKGQPVLPAYVGRSTSQMTTKGSYTVKTAPAASSTANVLPVPATFRWLAADVPGQQGQSVLQWPEHSGNGPSFLSNDSFAPTVADLLHYDTSAKHDINMGRVVNFYWRYAQHMGMVMDSANHMTTPRAYTVQFVLLAHTMTNSQFQHIWDAGELVADDYYTDPTSHTVEKISDAVYQNKVVPINDGQGDNRAYFGLRPNKVETLFNNTPHVAQLATTTTVDSRPMVYTCIFNAGTASKVRIRGYGVNETVAADHKTSVVNNFILGRVQGKIGSTAASHLNVWEVLYYNRALSEEELSVNSHWLGGVYNFGTYR